MKAAQKITSAFLAFVFLFSSLGITISSMVCLKSGKGKVSFSYIEDCCAKTKTPAVAKAVCCDDASSKPGLPETNFILKKADCCDISNITIKLKDFQKTERSIAEQPVILHSLFYTTQALNASKAEHAFDFQYADLPPPLSGRVLLNHISTLII